MREMKDSGVEWIGEIPKSWRTIEIKYYCENVYAGGTPQSSNMNYWNGNIPWIPSGSCHDCKIYSAPKTITKEGFQNSSTKLIPANTALVAMTGATCGSTGYLTFESCANQSVTAYIENSDRANSMFLWFLLQAAKQYLLTFQTGGAQGGVNVENCKNLVVPFIRLETQQRIANYLDSKCSKIDAIIEREEAVIEKLKEYKQSVITEAVTKGLNTNVEMKDSGVEWIGEIPNHWNMVYAKQLFAQRKERAFETDEQLTSSQKYGIISQKSFMEMEERQVMQVLKGNEILKHVSVGDFVISMRSFQGGLEYSEVSGKISSAYVMLIPNKDKVYERYYKWLFKTKKYISALQGTSNLIRDGQALRFSNFVQVYLPIFSKEEQKEIADYLDRVCPKIEGAIVKRERLITKLFEYKKSLIYEVVTGKKEV